MHWLPHTWPAQRPRGCRLDEIRGIDPARDVDWLRGTVHVIGKFRKERDVPMQPDARAALREQLSKILGHSSVAVTEAHYVHLLKEDLVAASQQVKIPMVPRPGGNVVRLLSRSRIGVTDVDTTCTPIRGDAHTD